MRPINAKGWARIQETPVFAAAPTGSPQVFWNWARGQDATAQRVAWFLLRMADAMEKEDDLESFDQAGSTFDPDRFAILPKETRALMADFMLDPLRYIV